MKIEMQGPLSPALKQHTIDRLEAALGQHQEKIDRVMVRLADLNGPKGGVDQQCQLTIGIHSQPNIIIDERGEEMYATISLAADRAKNAVGRAMQKIKSRRSQTI